MIDLATERMLAEIDDHGVGRLVFNNPAKHNALSLDMWQGVADALECFEANDDVRVVVMSGAGGKSFVSGADISEFDSKRSNAEQRREYGRISARGGRALATFSETPHCRDRRLLHRRRTRHGAERGRPLRNAGLHFRHSRRETRAWATATKVSPSSRGRWGRRGRGTSCSRRVSSMPMKRCV